MEQKQHQFFIIRIDASYQLFSNEIQKWLPLCNSQTTRLYFVKHTHTHSSYHIHQWWLCCAVVVFHVSLPPTIMSATFIYLRIHEPIHSGNHFYCLNIYTFFFLFFTFFFLKNHLLCCIRFFGRINQYCMLSPKRIDRSSSFRFSHTNFYPATEYDWYSNELIGLIEEIEFWSNSIFIESNRKHGLGPHVNDRLRLLPHTMQCNDAWSLNKNHIWYWKLKSTIEWLTNVIIRFFHRVISVKLRISSWFCQRNK